MRTHKINFFNREGGGSTAVYKVEPETDVPDSQTDEDPQEPEDDERR